ncbi:hypothetical protein Esti_004328 [Eimeria stiedai]
MAAVPAEATPLQAAASASPTPPAAEAEATSAAAEATAADLPPPAPPQPRATTAAAAEGEGKKDDGSSSTKRSSLEGEHGFGAVVNPENKKRTARILERRERAQKRLEEAKRAVGQEEGRALVTKSKQWCSAEQTEVRREKGGENFTKIRKESDNTYHAINKRRSTQQANARKAEKKAELAASPRAQEAAEAVAATAEKEFDAAVEAALATFQGIKNNYEQQRERKIQQAAEKRKAAQEEDQQKAQGRMAAEAAVDKSIDYQRTLQAKRLASLPSLMEGSSSLNPFSSASTRPAAADNDQQQQQRRQSKEQPQQQQAIEQQRQLQQLESLIQSVGLEEQLLNELKNLKLDETTLFAEDVKRMEQRFVNWCRHLGSKERTASNRIFNERGVRCSETTGRE